MDQGTLLITTQVEGSDHGFRFNPIGFLSEIVGFFSYRSDPVGISRNPRCRNPIGILAYFRHRKQAKVPIGFRQRGFRLIPTGSDRYEKNPIVSDRVFWTWASATH